MVGQPIAYSPPSDFCVKNVVDNPLKRIIGPRISRVERLAWQAGAAACQSMTNRPSRDFRIRKPQWIMVLTINEEGRKGDRGEKGEGAGKQTMIYKLLSNCDADKSRE